MIWSWLALHGDVKTFFVATVPYDDSDATGQGVADLRLKATADAGDHLRFEAHHAVSTLNVPSTASPIGSGVALTAPELIDLTWQADTGSALLVRGRTDRLTAKLSVSNLDVTVGRQPITFGNGNFFTPMDVVNPFSAATIDTEYKPGVDAARMDGYFGMAGRLTGVVAWAGQTPVDARDLILAINGQQTFGVTDLQVLAGAVRGEGVFGAGFVSSVGPVGIHGDATLTLPEEEDPFVRAVAGADWRPTGTTTVSGEAYYQGFGASDPDDYLAVLSGPRFARGEVWQAGKVYGAVALSQEITPLVSGSVAVIGNLLDPSALIAPGLTWSVSDEAAMGIGGFIGVGERPDLDQPVPEIRSEFGLYPAAGYLQLKAYF